MNNWCIARNKHSIILLIINTQSKNERLWQMFSLCTLNFDYQFKKLMNLTLNIPYIIHTCGHSVIIFCIKPCIITQHRNIVRHSADYWDVYFWDYSLCIKPHKTSLYKRPWSPRGEQRYSCILSFTSVLDGGGWSVPQSSCFTLGNGTWYPLYRKLGGLQSCSGLMQNISSPMWFDSQTFQPIARSYTDYSIAAHH
jgi:hypothetical protein